MLLVLWNHIIISELSQAQNVIEDFPSVSNEGDEGSHTNVKYIKYIYNYHIGINVIYSNL